MHTPISSLNPLNWTIWLLHIALNCTILKCFAKSVVINKKNTMPWKADKPTQNSALQGISEQENFMIKVLFICHGRIRTFVWSGLKSRLLGNENGICTHIVPLFWYFTDLLTGLPSIKMNMICGERSSCGDERKAGRVYSADAIEAEMKRDFGIWFFMWHIPLKQDRIWGTFMNILRMNCWYLKQLPDNGCIVRNDRK